MGGQLLVPLAIIDLDPEGEASTSFSGFRYAHGLFWLDARSTEDLDWKMVFSHDQESELNLIKSCMILRDQADHMFSRKTPVDPADCRETLSRSPWSKRGPGVPQQRESSLKHQPCCPNHPTEYPRARPDNLFTFPP